MAILATTNKHLTIPAKRKKAVFVTVSTSSAIEGIHAPFKRLASHAGKLLQTAKGTGKSPIKPSRRPHAKSA